MGTITRNIFLFVPFVLTAVALALLVVTMLDQHSPSTLNSLYFLRVHTDNLSVDVTVDNVNIDANIGKTGLVPAYYSVGLTNYCTGPSNTSAPNFCSKPAAAYWFNPLEIWNLQNSPIKTLIPNEWEDALHTYQEASKWMYAAYVVALVTTIVTLLLGIASFFLSRITSILTWVFADIACLFTIAASATATAIFVVLKGVVDTKLKSQDVSSTLGTKLLAVTWVAAAFSAGAALLFSCGCCCGHTPHQRNNPKRNRSLLGRDNYERVPSPFKPEGPHDEGFGHQVPLYGQPQHQWPGQQQTGYGQQQHTGYEPYRQV